MRATTFFMSAAGLAVITACYGTPRRAPVSPEPTAAELARRQQVEDSLEGVRAAYADSLAAARMATDIANRARADSIEAARVAEGVASREGAATSSRLRTELRDPVHFEVADDRIDSDGGAALDRKVAILNANPTIRLQITGACDERGSEEYNQRLGDRRAASVKQYLIARGIDAGRLDARSAGEGTPIDDGSNETAWAKNRRADFVILSGAARLSMKE